MKSFTLADGVLPKQLSLSPEQQQALTDMADRIVAETLQENEDFIANDRHIDGRTWKKVKSREHVHVFRTRRSQGSKNRGASIDVNEKEPSRPRLLSNNAVEQHQRDAIAAGRPLGFVDDADEIHGEEASRTNTHSSTSEGGSFAIEDSVLAKTKPSYVPLITATGTMDGSVEDVAFGALANTKYAWEVRNSYTKNDGFDGRKVLATLQGPSEEDPFRFIGVKWATRDYGAFMTRRDVLFLESSGIALDSDGERVYYSLAHCIELAECPPLPGRFNIIRMNLSSCYIMRQLTEDKIDVFCRGYSDMCGEVPEGFSVNFFSAAVAAVSGMVECSYLKKLSWFMSHRRNRTALRRTRVTAACAARASTSSRASCSPADCRAVAVRSADCRFAASAACRRSSRSCRPRTSFRSSYPSASRVCSSRGSCRPGTLLHPCSRLIEEDVVRPNQGHPEGRRAVETRQLASSPAELKQSISCAEVE